MNWPTVGCVCGFMALAFLVSFAIMWGACVRTSQLSSENQAELDAEQMREISKETK